MQILSSTEEALQQDLTVPDRGGSVDSFALAQVFKDPARIGDLFFFSARLASQDSGKELEGDRADMGGPT